MHAKLNIPNHSHPFQTSKNMPTFNFFKSSHHFHASVTFRNSEAYRKRKCRATSARVRIHSTRHIRAAACAVDSPSTFACVRAPSRRRDAWWGAIRRSKGIDSVVEVRWGNRVVRRERVPCPRVVDSSGGKQASRRSTVEAGHSACEYRDGIWAGSFRGNHFNDDAN